MTRVERRSAKRDVNLFERFLAVSVTIISSEYEGLILKSFGFSWSAFSSETSIDPTAIHWTAERDRLPLHSATRLEPTLRSAACGAGGHAQGCTGLAALPIERVCDAANARCDGFSSVAVRSNPAANGLRRVARSDNCFSEPSLPQPPAAWDLAETAGAPPWRPAHRQQAPPVTVSRQSGCCAQRRQCCWRSSPEGTLAPRGVAAPGKVSICSVSGSLSASVRRS
jgi:hypothetical protein